MTGTVRSFPHVHYAGARLDPCMCMCMQVTAGAGDTCRLRLQLVTATTLIAEAGCIWLQLLFTYLSVCDAFSWPPFVCSRSLCTTHSTQHAVLCMIPPVPLHQVLAAQRTQALLRPRRRSCCRAHATLLRCACVQCGTNCIRSFRKHTLQKHDAP